MVDRPGTELDGEADGARLRELVTVQPEREAGRGARTQVAVGLRRIERAALEEHVGRLRECCRLRQHLREEEVDVGVGSLELGRHRVRSEPGGNAAGGANRAQLGELGVVVEPVPGLPLERGRAVRPHPGTVSHGSAHELVLAGSPRRPHRREDAAAGGVKLLVRGAARAQRELGHPIAAEARVRVTVDEAGDRREAAPVYLLDVTEARRQVAHRPERLDEPAAREDERALCHVHAAQRPSTERACDTCRRCELREVADQKRRVWLCAHDPDACPLVPGSGLDPPPAAPRPPGMLGRSSPPSRAASSASG